MNTIFKLIFALAAAGAVSIAQSQKMIDVRDFGVAPNSFIDATEGVKKAIERCKSENNGATLVFPKGRYDFWHEKTEKREYFISNTSSEEECPSKIKNIGLLFEGVKNLTVEGNGSIFVFHGKMITIGIDHCENIEMRNLSVDFERPSMSELSMIEVNSDYLIASVHPDSKYAIIDSKLFWYGEGYNIPRYHVIMTDTIEGTAKYRGWNPILEGSVTELEPFKLRIDGDFRNSGYAAGQTLTVRDPYRDHVGVFVNLSKNIRLYGVNMHYMHGLGIISQFSENLTYRRVNITPSRGRTIAAFADGMHFSGCKGKILIDSCRFKGLHDDPVNVHGTYLKITEIQTPTRIKVRFMHGQTYGFAAFYENDTVGFVNSAALLTKGKSKVKTARLVSEREMLIELESPLPKEVSTGYCVENLTWTPSLQVCNNRFEMTCTRGLLVTTPRSIRIENNVFYRTGMYGILIACDAGSWYESGAVNDAIIRGNLFDACGYNILGNSYAISIEPEVHEESPKHQVHRNIRIENNTFKTLETQVIKAKFVDGLIFENNLIEKSTWQKTEDEKNSLPAFKIEHCKRDSGFQEPSND